MDDTDIQVDKKRMIDERVMRKRGSGEGKETKKGEKKLLKGNEKESHLLEYNL